jgi:hypothetical protein
VSRAFGEYSESNGEGVLEATDQRFVLPDTDVPLHPALLDIMMLALCAGVERSEKQWRALLDSIGLQIIKIWRTPGVEAVIETMLKA